MQIVLDPKEYKYITTNLKNLVQEILVMRRGLPSSQFNVNDPYDVLEPAKELFTKLHIRWPDAPNPEKDGWSGPQINVSLKNKAPDPAEIDANAEARRADRHP